MSKPKYPGICSICEQEFAKSGFYRHIKTHDKLPGGIILQVSGAYSPEFWLYLAVNPKSKLSKLDQFLRDIWLECCGHLSVFEIDGLRYDSCFDGEALEYADSDMEIVLSKVLEKGLVFSHEYDFGSTTHLKLKVIDIDKKWDSKESIVLLGRNILPEFKCVECGKKATELCIGCEWQGKENTFCKKCYDKHECSEGEDLWLPIVNSPRMGVCGYTG